MTSPADDRPGLDQPGIDEPGLGGGTATLTQPEVEATPRTSHGDGDHERFAHYVRKEKILESALSGDPVIALCGKVWIPGRDPQRFPVCPACKEIYGIIPAGGGGGSDGGGDES